MHTHVHIYIYPLYIYIHIYYSATNKNEILPFLSYVDGPREYYGKWNKSHIKRQMFDFTYMRYLE